MVNIHVNTKVSQNVASKWSPGSSHILARTRHIQDMRKCVICTKSKFKSVRGCNLCDIDKDGDTLLQGSQNIKKTICVSDPEARGMFCMSQDVLVGYLHMLSKELRQCVLWKRRPEERHAGEMWRRVKAK